MKRGEEAGRGILRDARPTPGWGGRRRSPPGWLRSAGAWAEPLGAPSLSGLCWFLSAAPFSFLAADRPSASLSSGEEVSVSAAPESSNESGHRGPTSRFLGRDPGLVSVVPGI